MTTLSSPTIVSSPTLLKSILEIKFLWRESIHNTLLKDKFARSEYKKNLLFTHNFGSCKVFHVYAFTVCNIFKVLHEFFVSIEMSRGSNVVDPFSTVGHQVCLFDHNTDDFCIFNKVSLGYKFSVGLRLLLAKWILVCLVSRLIVDIA